MSDGGLPSLEWLSLEGNAIGDTGCATLACAVHDGSLPKLTEANLTDNAVSSLFLCDLKDELAARAAEQHGRVLVDHGGL